ncbi:MULTISPECIES: c-type cytochrome [Candidatus Pelagibacter]|jgi:cytochrome c556|uniref:c-type cytochrome n=1 Tax=Candidatus Pelagibacter TaxID=198251 RepID=UPI00094DE835|nr:MULTISPECIES: cytochrome c [Pelagibacter]ARJ48597.1 cytochrome C [Candidatus Pelagibacter sp. RS40]MDC3026159.1 cytochrome c [Candidatus Pelagibacter sp.]|tara:strand:- start:41 stop:490 length:450 start_codon:yes stop_codon:yes gene_type:complete
MKNKFLLFIFVAASFLNTNFIAHSEESIEDIIKGRKAIFSNNAKLAKRVNILLREFEVEEAEPIIFEMSKNYENLLNYFPENSKEGYGTEALPIIWEEKDAFNALMQKAADDMLQLAKVMEEVDDIQATYKKLMWANCNACHSRYRKPH